MGAPPPLAVIGWPFDRALPDVGMGAGAALLAGDPALHAALWEADWAPTVQRVPAADPAAGEIARTFELLRALAGAVRGAVARGAFPLVFAGGCLSAAGTVAGSGARGAVWLDAHADLDTPEDNLSGFLDVMALSLLTGGCWAAQRATIDGFSPLAEADVALLGVRDLAPYQADQVARAATRRAAGRYAPAAAAGAIEPLPVPLYLHVDLDVLDPSVGRANHYAAPGGPSLETVLATVDAAFDHGRVAAATLSAYDPSADRDGRILAAARTIAARIARRAREQT
jgi:arginase